ncbi:tetratricopeptide repeat-containing sulfotransferase family protein [Sphingopyxis indica]|uniref:Tetratricopeptide repeat-containing protein n=1 Tax=Sphingopyxis indica TaxID=436663 RepID=A0A239GEB7_9SPHN|nr:sulfotransferase [Sphingopyxis indica]SNS66823.1 Tetratricopeptide repeat-containing protein [Sphingopyxis indica]
MNVTGTVTTYSALTKADELAAAGRLEAAAQRVIEHLRRHPDEPKGLAKLGELAMLLGALGQAEQFLRSAILRGENGIGVRRNLASVLNQQERLDEARAMFEALAEESDDPTIAALHALALDKLGRADEARAILEQLIEAHPDQPHYRISHGHILRAAGQVDEAVAAYRKAAEIDYECGEAWWGLASIKSRIFTDADIETMRKGLNVAIDIRNSAPLHFALGRALHDRKHYAEAFDHYREGNRQRAESIGYDARELTDEVAEIEQVVDRNFIASLPEAPAGDATPVFIVSLPRSGSTLLEQMLGSHPDVEPVGELPYAPAILRGAMEMATRRGPSTVPQLIAALSDEQAAAMGDDYLRRASLHRRTDARHFIDKLPHNWSNILFLRKILPQAKFLDIRRPAMDCCFSNFTQSFSRAHASSFALEHIGQCYADYVRLMTHLDRIAPGLIHHIDYAAMVEDSEPQLRRALAHLGLDWDPAVLEFHKLDRVVRTPSSEQVRRPLNRDGMEVWRPYAEWLGPLREALGKLAE